MHTSKYAQVQAGIVNLIAKQNIGPGGILPTEKELATEFNVSLITIRRALKNLQDDNIVSREQGRGTFVIADIKTTQNSGLITFLNVSAQASLSPFISQEVTLMGDHLGLRGYKLNHLNVGVDPESGALSQLKDSTGVIACGHLNDKWLQWLNGLNQPVVLMGDVIPTGVALPGVVYDWRKMALEMTKSLVDKGHKKIALVTGGKDYAPSEKMVSGFKAGMSQSKLAVDPSLIMYMEGDCPAVNKFAKDNAGIDAIIVERGGYEFILEGLLDTKKRPHIAVLGVSVSKQKLPSRISRAGFPENISQAAVELLFDVMNASGKTKSTMRKLKPKIWG